VIPLFKPSCSDLEIQNVTQVLRSGWWGGGPVTEELEEQFAKRVGVKYAVATNNCTSALQIACEALGVRGGEVIMPALTFAATGLSVLHSGARVVLADIKEDTLCLDWNDVQGKITPQTKAIIPVWYAGTVTASLRFSPPVIEDCAHAAGSRDAGLLGLAACWSFNAVKNLASGDGGMITTNNKELASRVRRLRRFGIDHAGWDYEIPSPGWKADMNDITAAIALAQLQRLDEMNEIRRKIVLTYLKEFSDLIWLELPAWDANSSWHMFVARTNRRNSLIAHMYSHGVSAGVHYKPLNQHKIFGEHGELPVTDRVWKTLVTFPLYPDMTENDIEQVVDAVRSFRV
jgi:perosamine synthetase